METALNLLVPFNYLKEHTNTYLSIDNIA